MTPPLLSCENNALFLDLDGTLAPIVERASGAALTPAGVAVLRACMTAFSGRVAILSGRALSDARRMTHGLVHAIAGSHGLDLTSSDGVATRLARPEALDPVRACLQTCDYGLSIEDKGGSIALHYRERPHLQSQAERLVDDFAHAYGLVATRGKMVAEVRLPGADKGSALRSFMASPPFEGATPVHVGDDHTDADAFRAAEALSGFGVLVGDAPVEGARYRLADPEAVVTWLNRSIAACASSSSPTA